MIALRLEKPNSFDGDIESTWHLVNVRNAINSPATFGLPVSQCFKLESLILAQNERWRQA
jgi:hypothetical protein